MAFFEVGSEGGDFFGWDVVVGDVAFGVGTIIETVTANEPAGAHVLIFLLVPTGTAGEVFGLEVFLPCFSCAHLEFIWLRWVGDFSAQSVAFGFLSFMFAIVC